MGNDEINILQLPLSCEEVSIFNEIDITAIVYARYSKENRPGSKMNKYDIDVCDSDGALCVSMKGFSVREYTETEKVINTKGDETEIIYGILKWHSQEGVKEIKKDIVSHYYTETKISGLSSKVINQNHSLGKRGICIFEQVFEDLKTLMLSKPKDTQRIVVVIKEDKSNYMFAPLKGLFATAKLENPKIEGKLVIVSKSWNNDAIKTCMQEEVRFKYDGVFVKYNKTGSRHIKKIEEFSLNESFKNNVVVNNNNVDIKEASVYVITGGMGSLGQIFAKHLAANKKVSLILTGRSPLEGEKERVFNTIKNEIETLGSSLTYEQVELSQKTPVTNFIKGVIKKHKKINGIIHSAGVIKDNFILKKDKEEIVEVFEAKVDAVMNIDESTKELDLDFMCLFSSMVSLGNVGQFDLFQINKFNTGYSFSISDGDDDLSFDSTFGYFFVWKNYVLCHFFDTKEPSFEFSYADKRLPKDNFLKLNKFLSTYGFVSKIESVNELSENKFVLKVECIMDYLQENIATKQELEITKTQGGFQMKHFNPNYNLTYTSDFKEGYDFASNAL